MHFPIRSLNFLKFFIAGVSPGHAVVAVGAGPVHLEHGAIIWLHRQNVSGVDFALGHDETSGLRALLHAQQRRHVRNARVRTPRQHRGSGFT